MRIFEHTVRDATSLRYAGYLDHGSIYAAGHVLTNDLASAHLSFWTLYTPTVPFRNAVMAFLECPLYEDYARIYTQSKEFHTAFCYGRQPYAYPLTLDPIVFPQPPETRKDRRRDTTQLRNRKVFYAGTRVPYGTGKMHTEEWFGRVSLYHTRTQLVEDLRNCGVEVHAEGWRWESYSRAAAEWEDTKRALAVNCGADFHLCCENSIYPDYVTEKIHHGFQTDLVVLYLGMENIGDYVPKDAFINLNPYYNRVTRRVDAVAVADRILTMTQDEYDSIIHAARRWRSSDYLEERRIDEMRRITRVILERM